MTLKDMQDARGKKGVYFLYCKKEIVYIGYSSNIYTRMLEHKFENKKSFDSFKIFTYCDDIISQLAEVVFINTHKPKHNKLVVENLEEWYLTIPYDLRISIADNIGEFKNIVSEIKQNFDPSIDKKESIEDDFLGDIL
jgi:hypothetical protein